MSEELQIPPVVDLEALLLPIEGENPAGESLRYSGIYDEIAEARRADDDLNQGEWQAELKVADFGHVIILALPALTEKSKDLQIAVWLAEALVKKHGFAGFRDSLLLLSGLQENFWETLYPEIDEGDMEGRANAISKMDIQASQALKAVPITGVARYSFNDWEDSKKFDFPENIETLDSASQERFTELREQAEKERRVTATLWASEKALTRRAACEVINFTIDECWTALDNLNRVIEEKYDRNQMPGLSTLKKTLDEIHTQTKKILSEKRLAEPDELGEVSTAQSNEGENGTQPAAGFGGGGSVHGRRDALNRLGEIAAFFQRTEPHSPVAYLVQRAVKWGNMPLESWLQDVIKDETVLFHLRQTLGLSTGEDNAYVTAEEAPAEESWQ